MQYQPTARPYVGRSVHPQKGIEMATHTVFETEDGQVLTYDQEDVEHIEFSTPVDVHEQEDSNKRTLGKHHLNVSITFKDGTKPSWVSKEN